MATSKHLNLVPPVVEAERVEDLLQSGRTTAACFSPYNKSLIVFLPPNPESQLQGGCGEQDVYFASSEAQPSSERRLFISDTSIIFAAFQNFLQVSSTSENEWSQRDDSARTIRKLAMDYINFTKECWIHASQATKANQASLQFAGDHYRALYTCLSLFVVLYVPEGGLEDAPVGDELMEWLNMHFIEPSTEEGDHLSTLEKPWEDETFWPYLLRATMRGLVKAATFFLEVLSRHPSNHLRRLSSQLIPLLSTQPHLQSFAAERDFAHSSRRWRERVKAMRVDLTNVPESDRRDEYENWWDRMSSIVGILEGRTEVIEKVCDELGVDWKEISVAWGVFADFRLRRQDLPDVVARIVDELPPDPTDMEDMVHASLFGGDPMKALSYASQLDPWLAAHMADIMQSLGLIDRDPIEDTGLTVRDSYVLAYAEYLHSDAALWRLTAAYMFSCGEVGVRCADEVLLRVPLRLGLSQQPAGEHAAGVLTDTLRDVNAICFEYQREEVRRAVCRTAAQELMQKKEYGLAISYCSSAEDWPGLGRVVDRVLDEYIVSGPEKFTKYVSGIAPSLQALKTASAAQGVFIYRLMFAVRYAEFHQRMSCRDLQEAAWDLVSIFQEETAPKSWWGVLLLDALGLLEHKAALLFSYPSACLLLRRLEEVFTRSQHGSGEDYLRMLNRKANVTSEAALDQLHAVRLALARYFARCTMIGTGGKQFMGRKFEISA